MFPFRFVDNYLGRVANIVMNMPCKMRGVLALIWIDYLFYKFMYYIAIGPRLEAECEHRIIEIRSRQVATSRAQAAARPA